MCHPVASLQRARSKGNDEVVVQPAGEHESSESLDLVGNKAARADPREGNEGSEIACMPRQTLPDSEEGKTA